MGKNREIPYSRQKVCFLVCFFKLTEGVQKMWDV